MLFKASKVRFYMLFIFSSVTFCQSMFWLTFSPINDMSIKYYDGFTNNTINLLLNVGPIVALPILPFTFYLNSVKDGFRKGMILIVLSLFFAMSLRCVPLYISCGSQTVYYLILTAQIINAACGPYVMSSVTTLSTLWFPQEERAKATSIAILSNNLGSAVQFLLGPFLVPSPDKMNVLLITHFCLSLFNLALVLFYFPSRPKHFPSPSAYFLHRANIVEKGVGDDDDEFNLKEDLLNEISLIQKRPQSLYESLVFIFKCTQDCLQNKSFSLMSFLIGGLNGTFNAWSGVFAQILEPVGINQNIAGFFGFIVTITIIVGGVWMGLILDTKWGRNKHKSLLIVACVFCFLFCSIFTLSLPSRFGYKIPSSNVSLACLLAAFGLMLGASNPPTYELGVEFTFPISEIYSAGIITSWINIGIIVLLLVQPYFEFSELPVDKSLNTKQRSVANNCFALCFPTPVKNPSLVCLSKEALSLVDLNIENKEEIYNDDKKRGMFEEYFSGNKVLEGATPAAHCYAGHQFGHYSGQLGDGATMFLGQILNKKGEVWELQFKGAGKTPFSRTADGRKVLRSSIREFLASEALHYLNIPTTRCGTLVTSESEVIRDLFYTGDAIREKCSIITRIAPSFLRFGSYEIFRDTDKITGRQGPSFGNKELLKTMLDYTLKHHYSSCVNPDLPLYKQYLNMYGEVVRKTAILVAKWQCVGFCHGVLNTDNMSIIGVTIDYGPYGFMESFDPNFICNTSDNDGRYSYKEQPSVCKWNLSVLAESWSSIIPIEESLELLDNYDIIFETEFNRIMRLKLGLIKKEEEEDNALIVSLFKTMALSRCDFTKLFRYLSTVNENRDADKNVDAVISFCDSVEHLKVHHNPPIPLEKIRSIHAMIEANPAMIYHFGGDKEAIDSFLQKAEKFEEIKNKKDEDVRNENKMIWKVWIQTYIEKLNRDDDDEDAESRRKRSEIQNLNNPSFVLRNYVLNIGIKDAEIGDYEKVNQLFEIIKKPFEDHTDDDSYKTIMAQFNNSSVLTRCVKVS